MRDEHYDEYGCINTATLGTVVHLFNATARCLTQPCVGPDTAETISEEEQGNHKEYTLLIEHQSCISKFFLC